MVVSCPSGALHHTMYIQDSDCQDLDTRLSMDPPDLVGGSLLDGILACMHPVWPVP